MTISILDERVGGKMQEILKALALQFRPQHARMWRCRSRTLQHGRQLEGQEPQVEVNNTTLLRLVNKFACKDPFDDLDARSLSMMGSMHIRMIDPSSLAPPDGLHVSLGRFLPLSRLVCSDVISKPQRCMCRGRESTKY